MRCGGEQATAALLRLAGGTSVDLALPGYSESVVSARGGESVVHRASQDALDRLVAINVLVPVPEGERASSSPVGVPADGWRWFQRELEITGFVRRHGQLRGS